MYEYYNLEKYNILIFDPQFNYLNKFNKRIDGTKFNNKFKGSYLFTTTENFNINEYGLIYHIFLSLYNIFNTNYIFPYNKQCIHLYPGGGFADINSLNDIHKDTHIISTQPFVSKMLQKKKYTNVIDTYGATDLQKNHKIQFKSKHDKKLTVCFSSAGDYNSKGAFDYIKIVNDYCDKYKNTVNFISIGNCPANNNIKHYNIMSQYELDSMYNDTVDIILNLENGNHLNGWPLGIEGALQGCVLITTDIHNCNNNLIFSTDEIYIIKNINEVETIIRNLDLNRTLLNDTSIKIQKKSSKLFSYDSVQKKIFEYIDVIINEPQITTLISTYNQEKTISKAIDSVLSQKCKYKHNIVITDDGSTDNTAKICLKYKKSYPDIISVNINKKNKGPRENFLSEFNKIKTKYTAFLEGDDFWCNDYKLEKQIAILEENTECVCSCHNTISRNSGTDIDIFPSNFKSGIYNESNFKILSHPSSRVFNTYIVRSKITDIMDIWDLCFQSLVLSIGSIYYLSDKMSVYNITKSGMWSSLSPSERCKYVALAQEYLKKKLNDFNATIEEIQDIEIEEIQDIVPHQEIQDIVPEYIIEKKPVVRRNIIDIHDGGVHII